MRRIGRYILNGLTVLSLVLFLAAIGLWVRSYRITEHAGGSLGPMSFMVASGVGWPHLILAADTGKMGRYYARHETPTRAQWANRWDPGPNRFGFAFRALRTVGPPVGRWRHGNRLLLSIWVPYWFLATITAAIPAAAMVGKLKRQLRRRSGRCPKCGYDLRATPDRCPECGTIPTKVKA